MSVAIVGGAAIGVAGTVYSANKASKSAKRAGKRADRADQRRMDFEQERYDEWQATYGDLEDNLANYYETLTPTLRIAQGLEAYEKEKERAFTNLNEDFAKRNIDRSGINTQLLNDQAISSAEERARIRAAAPMEVAREQSRFLKIGLDQNPDEGMRNAMTTEQTRSASLEQETARNAGQASGAVVDSLTGLAQGGLDKYVEYRKSANPTTGV